MGYLESVTERLVGKRTIVTGAGSGIGQAAARLFAAEGALVLCADIDGESARQRLGASATAPSGCASMSPSPTTARR